MSTKQLGVSSATEVPRAVCSALVFDAEVDVMSDFELEERLNRFIGRLCFANFCFGLVYFECRIECFSEMVVLC